ncbi:Uncharacterised protein [Mycobacteroides abscessus subsp. abscessus]|nr:Uncharacterised protein [Mycobacteroides abscessus subsp. abscessus]
MIRRVTPSAAALLAASWTARSREGSNLMTAREEVSNGLTGADKAPPSGSSPSVLGVDGGGTVV